MKIPFITDNNLCLNIFMYDKKNIIHLFLQAKQATTFRKIFIYLLIFSKINEANENDFRIIHSSPNKHPYVLSFETRKQTQSTRHLIAGTKIPMRRWTSFETFG